MKVWLGVSSSRETRAYLGEISHILSIHREDKGRLVSPTEAR